MPAGHTSSPSSPLSSWPAIMTGGSMKLLDIMPDLSSHGNWDAAATSLPHSVMAMSQALAVERTWYDFSVKFGCLPMPPVSGFSAAAPCQT